MDKLFEKIFYENMNDVTNLNSTREINSRLENNKKILKSRLSKREKKLLLRIIDDKDLIIEESSLNSFIYGFKTGAKFGYEINQN